MPDHPTIKRSELQRIVGEIYPDDPDSDDYTPTAMGLVMQVAKSFPLGAVADARTATGRRYRSKIREHLNLGPEPVVVEVVDDGP